MDNLNKENFWNELYADYSEAIKHFCEWIDDYKQECGWEKLFSEGTKFHDIPIEMQHGILTRYEFELENDLLIVDKSNYIKWMKDYRNRIRKFFKEFQEEIKKTKIVN